MHALWRVAEASFGCWYKIENPTHLYPCETIMDTLSTGKRRGSDGWSGRVRAIPGLCLDLHALVAKQLEAGTAMNPVTPVMPEEQNRRPLDATARSPGAALPSPRHSIGTA